MGSSGLSTVVRTDAARTFWTATGLRNTSSSERSKMVRIFSQPSASVLRLTVTGPRNCLLCHCFLATWRPHQWPTTKEMTVVPKKMAIAETTFFTTSGSFRNAQGMAYSFASVRDPAPGVHEVVDPLVPPRGPQERTPGQDRQGQQPGRH